MTMKLIRLIWLMRLYRILKTLGSIFYAMEFSLKAITVEQGISSAIGLYMGQ